MSHKISITIDDDAFDYLETKGGKNRSAFIAQLLRDKAKQDLERELAQQLMEDSRDSEGQDDAVLIEQTFVSDGLEDWDDDWDDSKAPRNLVG